MSQDGIGSKGGEMFKKKSDEIVLPEADAELIQKLSKQYLLHGLAPDHVERFASLVEERRVKAGAEILHEGAYSGDLYLVIEGDADASVRGRHRWTHGPGDFFGEQAIVHHTQATTVKALTDMDLGVIDADALKQIIESEPEFAFHMIERLIFRLEEISTRPVGELL